MKAIGWILVGVLIGVILFAWIMLTLASSAVSQIEEKYERPHFSHPPMDLRLKHKEDAATEDSKEEE